MAEPKRRASDVISLETLDLRVSALEQGMEDFKLQVLDVSNEVKAATRLIEEIHGKTDEMYEIFNSAKSGFHMVSTIANWGLRVVERAGRIAKPLFWVGAIGAAVWTWMKTGTWPK